VKISNQNSCRFGYGPIGPTPIQEIEIDSVFHGKLAASRADDAGSANK
jgi:hypothetical protein